MSELIREHRREMLNGSELFVRWYKDGCREVLWRHEESWHAVIAVPRDLAARVAKERLRWGVDADYGCWAPDYLCRAVVYSGPGLWFVNAPTRSKRRFPRYIVVYQSGGMDV